MNNGYLTYGPLKKSDRLSIQLEFEDGCNVTMIINGGKVTKHWNRNCGKHEVV